MSFVNVTSAGCADASGTAATAPTRQPATAAATTARRAAFRLLFVLLIARSSAALPV